MKKKINKIKRKKINKIKASKLESRLSKLVKVQTIEEGYVITFGQYKGFSIEELIDADFRYVEWCLDEKLFYLNDSLQDLLETIIDERTFNAEDYKEEKIFPWD